MKKTIYNLHADTTEEGPPVVFEFSSKGMCKDGSQGIDFVATGAAIIDIAQFRSRLVEGTSYASPNAAGSVACLLSALKQNSIQYSPFSIKFALFKTAFLPENGNSLEFGHGIIQIDAAFNYCKDKQKHKIPIYLNNGGGIVFVQNYEDQVFRDFEMDLSCFINSEDGEAAKWTFKLSTEAAKYISLMKKSEKNSINVKIVTSNMEPGSLYFNEIQVMDLLNPSLGAVFYYPVTVVVPLKITDTLNNRIQKEITLHYENSYHFFFLPHFESNNNQKCEITITTLEFLKTKI